jgi:hypothetical protein
MGVIPNPFDFSVQYTCRKQSAGQREILYFDVFSPSNRAFLFVSLLVTRTDKFVAGQHISYGYSFSLEMIPNNANNGKSVLNFENHLAVSVIVKYSRRVSHH